MLSKRSSAEMPTDFFEDAMETNHRHDRAAHPLASSFTQTFTAPFDSGAGSVPLPREYVAPSQEPSNLILFKRSPDADASKLSLAATGSHLAGEDAEPIQQTYNGVQGTQAGGPPTNALRATPASTFAVSTRQQERLSAYPRTDPLQLVEQSSVKLDGEAHHPQQRQQALHQASPIDSMHTIGEYMSGAGEVGEEMTPFPDPALAKMAFTAKSPEGATTENGAFAARTVPAAAVGTGEKHKPEAAQPALDFPDFLRDADTAVLGQASSLSSRCEGCASEQQAQQPPAHILPPQQLHQFTQQSQPQPVQQVPTQLVHSVPLQPSDPALPQVVEAAPIPQQPQQSPQSLLQQVQQLKQLLQQTQQAQQAQQQSPQIFPQYIPQFTQQYPQQFGGLYSRQYPQNLIPQFPQRPQELNLLGPQQVLPGIPQQFVQPPEFPYQSPQLPPALLQQQWQQPPRMANQLQSQLQHQMLPLNVFPQSQPQQIISGVPQTLQAQQQPSQMFQVAARNVSQEAPNDQPQGLFQQLLQLLPRKRTH